MKPNVFIVLILIIVFFSAPIYSSGNQYPPFREADYSTAGKFTEKKLGSLLKDTSVNPNWLNDSSGFWYQYRTTAETKYILVGLKERSKKPLFDRKKLAALLKKIDGKPVDSMNIPISDIRIPETPEKILFTFKKKKYKYDILKNKLTRPAPEKKDRRNRYESLSPDRKLSAFSKHFDLFLIDKKNGGQNIRLTHDSKLYYGFNDSDYDYVNAEKIDPLKPSRSFVIWAPDSQKFLTLRTDVRNLKPAYVLNSTKSPRPQLIQYKVSLPDDEPRKYEVWIFNHKLKKMIRVKSEKWPYQEYGDFVWSKDSSKLYMIRKSKDQLKCDLLSVDPETGEAEVLIEERNAGMILTQPVVEINMGKDLVWFSRRNGFGNYYLFGIEEKKISDFINGRINSDRILNIDLKENNIYFTARKDNETDNPYYTHLFKANLRNRKLTCLTTGDFNHKVELSPDMSCFIDNYSRPDTPPVSILKDIDGNTVMELEEADVSHLKASGWKSPEIFREKAADGSTDIWGVMWTPFNLNSKQKYPVITFVYPGPQDEVIPRNFFERNENSHLAQYGFIVLIFGNRGGSQLRSLEYSEAYRGNLRDFGIDDKVAVIRKMASKNDFMDLHRVGIWGGSSGGFMTVTAMMLYPEFFKVGVSRSGVQDPSTMYRWWGDSFQGVTETRDIKSRVTMKSTRVPSNLEIAHNLKGRLLLIQGESDTIVPPSNAIRLSDALMKLKKRFDFILVPGGAHWAGEHWPYIKNRVWLYFIEHLMGDKRYSHMAELQEFMENSK